MVLYLLIKTYLLTHDARFIEGLVRWNYVTVSEQRNGQFSSDCIQLLVARAATAHCVVMGDEKELLEGRRVRTDFLG